MPIAGNPVGYDFVVVGSADEAAKRFCLPLAVEFFCIRYIKKVT